VSQRLKKQKDLERGIKRTEGIAQNQLGNNCTNSQKLKNKISNSQQTYDIQRGSMCRETLGGQKRVSTLVKRLREKKEKSHCQCFRVGKGKETRGRPLLPGETSKTSAKSTVEGQVDGGGRGKEKVASRKKTRITMQEGCGRLEREARLMSIRPRG